MRPLKNLLGQFVSEGVLIQDNYYFFAFPLVIVNKKDGGFRMAIDYREVNMHLETTVNQPPYQPTLFQNKKGVDEYFKEYGIVERNEVFSRYLNSIVGHHGV